MTPPLDLSSLPLDRLLLKRKSLRRDLQATAGHCPIRIAVLSGSTTGELCELLELWLLNSGFAPVLYQSRFGQFEAEALHDPAELIAFRPDVIYLHTSVLNLEQTSTPADEVLRFEGIWGALKAVLPATIIQNSFELPPLSPLGNLDTIHGRTAFVLACNRLLVSAIERSPHVLLNDVSSISARIGLDRWFDPVRYFTTKIVTTPLGSNALAISLAAMIRGLYGKARKVLVLDLDNTLWGGVIGDDGVDCILLGSETPVAQAYAAFQRYCLGLREEGILLAVCSKNELPTAQSGFQHPDSILKLEHFAAFRANWDPKPHNLASIAAELNLGLESFVFVDDNPAERDIVRAQLPGVAVPDLTADVADYPRLIESHRYFEQVTRSQDDLARAAQYQQNSARLTAKARYANYGEYLDALEMEAEIAPFRAIYLDRIAQLTNKTNQFNLTTRRYTRAELELLAADPSTITLYGRLADRFGDNGLVSVILGRREGSSLVLDLWLMSCRVLKRDMELAMLDSLVAHARAAGVKTIQGAFIPSRKNDMVADHYLKLGFEPLTSSPDGSATYLLEVEGYTERSKHILIRSMTAAEAPIPAVALP